MDGTPAELERYVARCSADKVRVLPGPRSGYVANFLSLTCNPLIHADYYAFSDQDDVWMADKLERSIRWLGSVPAEVPAVYCSRTLLVDCEDQEIGLSPLFRKPASFANALMQNIGGGNTMVFNNAARELLMQAGQDIDVAMHDWWVYIAVMACGGRVHYDPVPTVRYRQHGKNLVGSNADTLSRLMRIKMLWGGRFKELNDQHIRTLDRIAVHMTPENRRSLASFERARNTWLVPRLLGFARIGLYRQTLVGNLGLIAATLFNRT
jgi:hypothetical protein